MQRTLRRIGFEHVLGTLMTAVTGFGLWVTIRAMSVLATAEIPASKGRSKCPMWSSVHFLSALLFVLLLPFQLWSGARRQSPSGHRLSGM